MEVKVNQRKYGLIKKRKLNRTSLLKTKNTSFTYKNPNGNKRTTVNSLKIQMSIKIILITYGRTFNGNKCQKWNITD